MDQQPAQVGGPGSDTSFIGSAGTPTWQLLADNIQLTAPATVARVAWWAFYGGPGQNHSPPSGPETIRIRFYPARSGDGLPDSNNILFEQSFLNPPRTDTGRVISVGGLPREFFFQVDLSSPVAIPANDVTWLEIAQIGDIDSTYRWETGFGVHNGFAFSNPQVPNWHLSSGSLAFQLFIPEPVSLSIVALFLVTAYPVRRRKRGRMRSAKRTH